MAYWPEDPREIATMANFALHGMRHVSLLFKGGNADKLSISTYSSKYLGTYSSKYSGTYSSKYLRSHFGVQMFFYFDTVSVLWDGLRGCVVSSALRLRV